jgi:hypothetical protein
MVIGTLPRMPESAVPILPSRNLEETLEFYSRLGFELQGACGQKLGKGFRMRPIARSRKACVRGAFRVTGQDLNLRPPS